MKTSFTSGNQAQLLSNGSDFFPALLQAMNGAHKSILLESYIYENDEIGQSVSHALIKAARSGIKVHLTLDGFGSATFLKSALRDEVEQAGVNLHIYHPLRFWQIPHMHLRRLHRKLAVIDDKHAFIGGINIQDDLRAGPVLLPYPRTDFAVKLEGPIVESINLTMRRLIARLELKALVYKAWFLRSINFRQTLHKAWKALRRKSKKTPATNPEGLAIQLIERDNLRNRRTIEQAYLEAIRHAQKNILICNAYFFPGKKLSTAIKQAAQRGVKVKLLLQGKEEYYFQHLATQALYDDLLGAGIEIYEFTPSFLHAKVAVIDDDWSTVGSSNLDPFSLLLAREANIIVRSVDFRHTLQTALERLIEQKSIRILAQSYTASWRPRFMRHFSRILLRILIFLSGKSHIY